LNLPPVVSAEEWQAALDALLVKEKEATRARDALAAERRRLPWVHIERDYVFDGPEGKTTLLDLFFGVGPETPQEGVYQDGKPFAVRSQRPFALGSVAASEKRSSAAAMPNAITRLGVANDLVGDQCAGYGGYETE
jgi:hypothetical protein